MDQDEVLFEGYTTILKEELLTALGCTEPVCIAYCSARMREALGAEPEKILAKCSGNLIKNAKGAIVPNSGNLKGIEAAAILGAVGGNPDKALEVLTDVTEEQIRHTRELLDKGICRVELLEAEEDKLHVIVEGEAHGHQASAELKHTHTNIVCVKHDGQVIFSAQEQKKQQNTDIDKLCKTLTVRDIIRYAENVELDQSGLRELIRSQVKCNSQIAEEGLSNSYGACVGKILLKDYGNNLHTRAQAYAAAGSDARMSGCELPVVINSGSGNQGITVCMPVVEYAYGLGKSEEELIRSLLLSNLIAIRIKSSYGRLSAFCGAVSAATGSGAAITWMSGGSYEQICGTIVNALGTISGMVCDGAKPSCASKIASAVDAALMAHSLSMEEKHFNSGDGLVKEDIEATIESIGRMASEGMIETDKKILQLMLEK